jgi:hypothetical protein
MTKLVASTQKRGGWLGEHAEQKLVVIGGQRFRNAIEGLGQKFQPGQLGVTQFDDDVAALGVADANLADDPLEIGRLFLLALHMGPEMS